MMKIALIADSHWGVRNDGQIFLDNTKKFLDEVFWPTIEKLDIKHVIHLGDMVDRRQSINIYTAKHLRENFLDQFKQRGIHLDWILGNHDIYWRNKIDVTIAKELRLDYNYVTVYCDATEVEIDNDLFLFVPWICDSNREQSKKLINKTQARFCIGHLELMGFEMYKGMVAEDGEDPSIYKKFKLTFTGHYHHKSFHGGIHYLGATGQFMWTDANDSRGFHILDTDTMGLDYIENPYPLYAKVFYDDANPNGTSKVDFGSLKGKFVRVIVRSRTNSDAYNNFMIKLEKAQSHELTVVEDHLNMDLVADKDLVSDAKDTLTIIRDYIAQTNTIVNSQSLDGLIVELYKEAQGVEK